jgi:hypothetical protein
MRQFFLVVWKLHLFKLVLLRCELREDALCNLYTGCTVVQKTANKIFFLLLSIMVQQTHLYIIKHSFKMSHIKTLKSTPTCFDHQLIIIRELICS